MLRRVGQVTLVLALLVVAVFGGTAVRIWQVAREDHRGHVDAILVLGASQFDGRPSQIFRARLDHARELYDEGVAERIVTVGGGRPGDRFTEAASGADYLRHAGVPAAAITAVGEGSDTLTSLEAAARELAGTGVRRVVLVTDPWHSMRSRRIASDAGFSATTSPARTGPAVRSRATEMRYIARETGAYLYYRVFRRSASGDRPPAAAGFTPVG